ncbi:fatty acid desaturase [Limibaculum sp. FT325]|uniref:fatty acid desaturase n=1 Tax=Thermohalobaculum sediminis TaxID=2939436 RepID=UPI0020BEEF32|nr:fatty acid desaturase [Limibaculum sediminis]MCL5775444.1 fatty acid desaturase [Limibaculum sediminis]
MSDSVDALRKPVPFEWPTLALIGLCYVAWALLTLHASTLGGWLAVPLMGIVLAFHSSLQHEVLHGHPFSDQRLSDALVFPALGLFVPYERFRDTHLAHHRDEILTDPYDDPESNYLDPAVWARLPGWRRALLRANNTLAGRMALGPAIGLATFWAGDLRAIRVGDPAVRRAYALHVAGLVPVVAWLAMLGTMPVWQYLLAAYLGLSLLKIRTFLEHRAHEKAAGRSVVIEDRGPLALLFLNNNFHAVHHASPRVAWYRLPALYRARREEVLRRNRGYRYASYREVFASHFLRAKDPVPHPLRQGPGEG